MQKDFAAGFSLEALELQQELMSRLGMASDPHAAALHYDAAEHLEHLAQELSASR